MEEQKPQEDQCGCNCHCGKDCQCDCDCCKKEREDNSKKGNDRQTILWHMHANDSIGSAFLGILAILLFVFLVRSNKRNRELLLEVISLRRQP